MSMPSTRSREVVKVDVQNEGEFDNYFGTSVA